jgi:hypothetical protein
MAIVLNIRVYYVQNLILKTAWVAEEGGAPVSSFVLTVGLYRMSENMTGTDKDHTEINCSVLVSFCCENSIVPYLYLANYGKFLQKDHLLVEQRFLFLEILTERENRRR